MEKIKILGNSRSTPTETTFEPKNFKKKRYAEVKPTMVDVDMVNKQATVHQY